MPIARTIVRNALTFHLNRLSPGEAEDADLFGRCLEALNDIADEMNGGKSFLFREVITASGSAINAVSALLGTAWASLSPGDQILGATYVGSGMDNPMWELTMAQYHAVPDKTLASEPQFWAHDGLATVYFYPVPNNTIKLRTKQVVSDFADLDTEYSMPKGFSSALSAMLAERMAPSVAPAMFGTAKLAASAARLRLLAQGANPAIIGDKRPRGSILEGY